MNRSAQSTGIVAAVPEAWYGYWQTRHYVLSGLARHASVVWVEPPLGARALLSGSPSAANPDAVFPDPPESMKLVRPSWAYPKIYRWPRLSKKLHIGVASAAARRLRKQGCDCVIGYLWRPEAYYLVDCGEFDYICYHVDDDYTFSDKIEEPSQKEKQIVSAAALTFVHSDRVAEKLAPYAGRIERVRNGVDYASYSRQWPCPDDLRRISRPRVGYSGYLKTQMDWELIIRLAEALPGLSFVFIGPRREQPELRPILDRAARLDNVHFLGGKPAGTLPAYVANLDVCLMPYRVTNYTQSINPLKLQEYLAAGKPVVTSDLENVRPYAGVVDICTSLDQWKTAVSCAASAPGDSGLVERRRAKARHNDWSVICDGIYETVSALAG